jgi:hypothetical protein
MRHSTTLMVRLQSPLQKRRTLLPSVHRTSVVGGAQNVADTCLNYIPFYSLWGNLNSRESNRVRFGKF